MLEKNTFEILHEDKDPKVIVVTPLLKYHKISKETKKTIKRNDTPYIWLTSSGNKIIPVNAELGMKWYKALRGKLPAYYLMIDNDIIMGRHMIDRLYEKLRKSPDNVAYSYASFEFKGYVNQKFPAIPFDIQRLLNGNYISSNSMIKTGHLEIVGHVKDDDLVRLLDYALWLKFYYEGFVGIPCPEASFIAKSSKDSISSGSNEDYQIKYKRVMERFGKPVLKKSFEEKNSKKNGVMTVL